MRVVRTASELAEMLAAARAPGRRVGLVPTMGALHEGHLALIRAARAECDVCVVSIFVNPTQFAPGEDYERYPRREGDDLRAARAAGVDFAFVPPVEEMYPPGAATRVHVGELGEILEGASRPGHFAGVATVVARLFNLVRPDVAYFGRKDAQQVAVVRRMVADLAFPVTIATRPTVRDRDGLALSSRNAYLSPSERRTATALYRALTEARSRSGGDPVRAEAIMREVLTAEPNLQLDYARAVDPDGFGEPRPGGPVLLVVAACVGRTRLIDNMMLEGEP